MDSGAFPGAVLAVGSHDSILFSTAVGHYGETDPRPVTGSTVYDIASVTKVVGLTAAVMFLVQDGKLGIDDRLSDFFPEMRDRPKARVTVRHLMTHTSGLASWRPLHLETGSRAEAVDSILAARLESAPGDEYVYSDLGAITLGLVVERVSGAALDDFLMRRLYVPLGMRWTRFTPPPEWSERIAPTEYDPWRGRVLRGEVHDENAARMGGIAGHAGLFSTGADLSRFAQWMLGAYYGNIDSSSTVFVDPEIVRDFVKRQPGPERSTRALGWDTPSDQHSSAGTLMSRRSFGHTGFTGTSIWIDPELDLFIVLLTNRVHPSRDNHQIEWIRPLVSDGVARAVESR